MEPTPLEASCAGASRTRVPAVRYQMYGIKYSTNYIKYHTYNQKWSTNIEILVLPYQIWWKYMPELFLTLPEIPNKRNDQFVMISLCYFELWNWMFRHLLFFRTIPSTTNYFTHLGFPGVLKTAPACICHHIWYGKIKISTIVDHIYIYIVFYTI